MVGVVAVGVAMRLAWLSQVFDISTAGSTDQSGYVRVAHAWASGNFSTGLLRTPLYPSFLAAAEAILHLARLGVPLRLPIGVAQVILAGLLVGVVGVLTRRLTGSAVAGVVAAAILAVWPNQIFGVGALMSELVATPLLFGATACASWETPERQTLHLRLGVAMLAALTLLARPALLPSVVVILAMTLRGTSPLPARSRTLVAQMAVLLLVLAPWLVVSSLKEGRPSVQMSSAGGFNLCIGNNPHADGKYVEAAAKGSCALRALVRGELAEADRVGGEGVRWALEHPGRQPYLVGQRTYWTFYMDGYWLDWYPNWQRYDGPWSQAGLRQITQLWWRWVGVLAVTGFIAGLLRWRSATVWLGAVAASTVLLPLITIGDPRFHDPTVPFMAIFSGMAVATAAGAARVLTSWSRRLISVLIDRTSRARRR